MFDVFLSPSKTTTHCRSKSSPNVPTPASSPFASNSYDDGNALALPASTYRNPSQGCSQSVNASRTLPPLVTRFSEPDQPSRPNSTISTKSEPLILCPEFDHSRLTRKEEARGKLSAWFQGESNSIKLGILPSLSTEAVVAMDSVASPSHKFSQPQKNPVAQSTPRPPMASRFSFFSSKSSIQKTTSPSTNANDEFLSLDVTTALFPAGPADPFSPAAFKNLVQNAEGLLSRIQAAYKERTASLQEMTVEKETLAEELEGSKARANYLEMQLDNMKAKLEEQDNAMMNLVDDLAHEKQIRREEDDVRKRSTVLVKSSKAEIPVPSAAKIENEPPLRRKSHSSIMTDSGFESEDDSYVDSVFSKSRGQDSPTVSTLSFATTTSPDSLNQAEFPMPLSATQATRPRPGASPLVQSTFQTVIKGISGFSRQDIKTPSNAQRQPTNCSNCNGMRSSEAWNLVSVLKAENRVLKERVEKMENTLDDCLNVVKRLET